MHLEPVEAVRAAITDIDRAHDSAVAAVNAASDPVAAMAAMNELGAHMQALADADAELRKQIAGRIWDAEKMSLAGLADRVSMSNRQAEQLVKDAKGGDPAPPPSGR